MSRQNGLPTAPDGRREYDLAQFTPAMQAKAIRFAAIFCGMFVILVWIPSATRYYGGHVYRNFQPDKRPELEKFDLSGPVKPISRTAIPGLMAELQANSTKGHVQAVFSTAHAQQGMVAWVQGAYDEPQNTRATSSIVVMGTMAYVTLAADGSVQKCHLVGDGVKNLGIEIDAGVWHTAISLSPRALEFRTRTEAGIVSPGAVAPMLQAVPKYGSKEGTAWGKKVMDACKPAS